MRNPHRNYTDNTVFIPSSFLPVDVPDDHIIKPGELSIAVDAQNMSANQMAGQENSAKGRGSARHVFWYTSRHIRRRPVKALLSIGSIGAAGFSFAPDTSEADNMRVLGTTKKRTRFMLTPEQTVLCVVGLACAVLVLPAINGWLPDLVIRTIGAYSALHFAACVAGAAICAVINFRAFAGEGIAKYAVAYGHVTDQMKRGSADRMESFIKRIQGNK